MGPGRYMEEAPSEVDIQGQGLIAGRKNVQEKRCQSMEVWDAPGNGCSRRPKSVLWEVAEVSER